MGRVPERRVDRPDRCNSRSLPVSRPHRARRCRCGPCGLGLHRLARRDRPTHAGVGSAGHDWPGGDASRSTLRALGRSPPACWNARSDHPASSTLRSVRRAASRRRQPVPRHHYRTAIGLADGHPDQHARTRDCAFPRPFNGARAGDGAYTFDDTCTGARSRSLLGARCCCDRDRATRRFALEPGCSGARQLRYASDGRSGLAIVVGGEPRGSRTRPQRHPPRRSVAATCGA